MTNTTNMKPGTRVTARKLVRFNGDYAVYVVNGVQHEVRRVRRNVWVTTGNYSY